MVNTINMPREATMSTKLGLHCPVVGSSGCRHDFSRVSSSSGLFFSKLSVSISQWYLAEWERHAGTVPDKIAVPSALDSALFWVEDYDTIRCNGTSSQVAEIFWSMHP
jgi:hypothetical protein